MKLTVMEELQKSSVACGISGEISIVAAGCAVVEVAAKWLLCPSKHFVSLSFIPLIMLPPNSRVYKVSYVSSPSLSQ
jgi:hypothetical protein